MEYSNCCNAPIEEDTDICSNCGEHCEEIEVDEEMEVSSDLHRKYDYDDPVGERQEEFCN